MNLSKSKYCEAVQCKKMLWLNTYKPFLKEDVGNSNTLDTGHTVGNLAKNLFGKYTDIAFSEDLNHMLEDTKKALNINDVIITEASFIYDGNFCSVDILKKEEDKYEIYEVKSSTTKKDIYIDDISYQYYVLTKLNLNVTKTFIVYLNSKYTRHGDLDLNKLFIKEDVTKEVIAKQNDIQKNIKDFKEYLTKKEEPEQKIGLHCTKPYECPFFSYCTKDLPENNIFKLRQMRASSKFKLYDKGIYSYEKLLNEDIDKKYKQQIEFELYNLEPTIDKKSIEGFMSTLKYPLYFLDFETYQTAIPEYDDISPYLQVPFQYSLHIIEEENSLMHKEFLADANKDPRRELAERLVADIPKDVCTIAYNMQFERMVIAYLAKIYPDLSEHLLNIRDNMKDLMIPFKNRNYYTKDMHGSFSIKYVLPALFPDEPTLNYKNLDLVHNGSEAQETFINLRKMKEPKLSNTRKALLKYCELDTLAMVKIWEKLNDVINRK